MKLVTEPLYQQLFPVHEDRNPPQTPIEMAEYLVKWGIMPGALLDTLGRSLINMQLHLEFVDRHGTPPQHDGSPLRIPAQWERSERILISWGRFYPDLWPMHAQMVEAVSQVAVVELLLPTEMWARAVAVYLDWRGIAKMDNVHFLILRTDDIWIRDYGPIIGIDDSGRRVALNPIYDVLPMYPQADDDGMNSRWAAHHQIPVQSIDLHTEGGNLWSDGQGTLIMSSQIFYSNPYFNRDSLEQYLHRFIKFEKLIITPRLTLEETGHVDLLVKLASEDLIFVSRAESPSTIEVMRKAKRLFQRETNASGQAYRVVELPTPGLYLNWFVYTIRRAYTNALTVNGRVLVPVFGIPQDEVALRIYEDHMPGYEIVPIHSAVGINGGGAVHCMTKEIPVA